MRVATSALHKQLDGLVGRLSDLSDYSRYLLATTAFRASVETIPASTEVDVSGFNPTRLHDELLLDCADLTLDPRKIIYEPAIGQGRSAHLGMMYVLEGSALGARLLMGDALRLGLNGTFGARHLAKQIARPQRWEEFLQSLETAEDFDLDAAMVAASRVFEIAICCAEANRRVP